MKGLIRRISTALLFVIVMLGGLYAGHYSFVILFGLITAICLWEFYGLVLARHNRYDRIRMALGVVMGLIPFLWASLIQLGIIRDRETFVALSALLLFPLLFLAFIYELYSGSRHPFTNVAYLILGAVYIGIPFSLLDFIAFDDQHYFYADTVFGLLLLTWTNDTGAYLVGSRIGKTPLFPRVSPNKTWEGFSGGVLITMLVAGMLVFVFDELSFVNWLILGLIVVTFGSIGDLVESMLKRSVHVKDSGRLLPGHGGLLDRFDGFIFLLPYAAAYLLWIR